ncbi:MAG: pantetheine-phosphate adenylyltransferase [Verrucomicrobiota bacterium]|nr:pantetheine-phosphate adenylyltransferase [Verrucomicrobiota bacterium]
MRIAIYPGTFDPVTKGHLDVLHRACRIFDKVIMAVAPSSTKGPLFTVPERVELIRANIEPGYNVEVSTFNGLLVDYARSVGACALCRGLRAVSDFEFEFQMAQMNRELADDVETIFFMPSQDYFYTSSNLVKQVACFAPERVDKLVPVNVMQALKHKFPQNHSNSIH